jgi:ABC-type glycerol-3-phosphate transport system substrate-binding protein
MLHRWSLRWFCVLLVLTTMTTVGFAKTPVRLVTYGTPETLISFQEMARIFNESNPDYELEVEIYPYAEYPTKITIMLATGVYPDVFLTWAQYKPAWADQGFLLDIEPFWKNSSVVQNARLYPFAIDAATYNGKLYGIPYDFSAMLWGLHVDALNNAGLPIPPDDWDVDMMLQYALKLNKPEQGMYGVKQAANYSISSWQWTVNYVGEGWVSPDLKTVNVEHPRNLEMLQFWQDLAWRYEVAWVAGKPAVADEFNGGYAMWTAWGHYGYRFEQSNFDYTFIPYPKGPAGQYSFAHGHLWTIPSGIKDPKPGWAVMEWMLSPEGQRVTVEVLGRQPLSANNDLWNRFFGAIAPERRARIQRAVMDAVYGQNLITTMNYWTSWADVDRIMNSHLANVMSQNASPASEMATAAQQIKAILNIK